MAETVRIGAIGHRGDGIAERPGPPLYVPFTLPGERVLVEERDGRGALLSMVEASPGRIAPVCRHFGRCGGCQLQMMPLAASRALKRRFVVEALAREGIATDVAETIGVSPASRRRAVLTAERAGGGIRLGYSERLSNRLIDVAECPVMVAEIACSLPALRRLLAPFLPRRGAVRVTVLATGTGLDVAVAEPAAAGVTEASVAAARAAGVARLSFGGEPALTLAAPVLQVAGVALTPPPGAFAQASAEAEAAMTDLVVGHLAGARRVADLFAGFGTFALALARFAKVHAVEASAPALAALESAVRGAAGLKPIATERRDLFAFPLGAAELARFDGVVFDPPRAGAAAQAAALATAKVARIAAVSCNPATFARDARRLVDGGFDLARVVPVDQFVHSAEVELVGLFERR